MKSIIMVILFLGGQGLISGRAVRVDGRLSGRFIPGGVLLISEILYDPDPPVSLPAFEFVEWYNAGVDTVDLAGWQWVVGDKVRRVAGGRVSPGGYVIVCSPAAAPAFRALGQVIAMESFPALVNSGERLALLNPAGIAVHTIEYSPDMFSNALKANGGWSLELADMSQLCNPAAWLPSIDLSGGTPGRANSQQVILPPAEPPILIRAAGYDDQNFVLLFSGTLDPQLDMNNYTCMLNPGSIYAPAVISREYGFPGLFFHLPDCLDPGLTYTIELSGTVTDCSTQSARLRPVLLGFPSEPDSAGVLITEVMFDPRTGQPEFVEVFNRSERVVDLKDLIVARADAEGAIGSFSNEQVLSYWLFPECYAVFTTDAKLFAKAWPLADPAIVAERPDMPSLTNVESKLILMDRNQNQLDVVAYSPDWHYPYLEDSKGVSLERIDVNISGTDKANWFSASAESGGATPGSKNSCSQKTPLTASQQFSLEPGIGYSTISPDPVKVAVRYRFEGTGWFMRVNIFSSGGQPVRELFPFGMAAVEGIVCWNGLDAAQRFVPDGIYLVVADYYHPSGKKGRWKKACAILRTY
ncbi:MAG: lamin tail domain-containing protein [Bacteroidia bacterium]|nr:lamin tail domain-containing protein [Bacteroidia bacterium]